MKKIFFIGVCVLFIIFAWAPWMGKTYFNEAAARSCGKADTSEIFDNPLFSPSYVNDGYVARYWAPFGRWEVHCRLSWYNFFTNHALWYVHE